MKRHTVSILVIGVLLGICLALALGVKKRSSRPVGTFQATVEQDGSDVWVLNTMTGDLYRYDAGTGRWDVLGYVPD